MISPLRYPGGKAGLSLFLKDTIELNNVLECRYYEPFAGGAGAALHLLASGCVSEIFLNDADPCIYAFWISALNETNRFIQKIDSVPRTIDEWKKQQEIHSSPNSYSTFDVGFASFYLNRCNRSGILKGAGPIGGIKQSGKWKLDARFNREALIKRLQAISSYREAIHFDNKDAIDFLKKYLPRGKGRENIIVYADPPYTSAGKRLYYNSLKQSDHQVFANYLLDQRILKFIISYDDCEFIRDLYSPFRQFRFSLRYSLQKKMEGCELLIVPPQLRIPDTMRMAGSNMSLKPLTN